MRMRSTRRWFYQLAACLPLAALLLISPLLAAAPPKTVAGELSLKDASGATRRLDQVAGARATVFLFIGTKCPISNSYAPEFAALEKAYGPKGVRLVLVYPDPHATAAETAKHTRSYRLSHLPILLDTEQKLADALGARVTPEAFLLDKGRTVRYAGRIDDGYADRGQRRARVSSRDLRTALDAVLGGKSVAAPRTKAVGCSIERAATRVASSGPTYARDVAPILQANCQSCHRAGEIGPFPLESYEDARRWAQNIVAVTASRRMPPWKPVAGHGDFQGVRRLTDTQIATLKRWADAGAPLGDKKTLPPPPRFARGWALGTPDLVLTMPKAWRVPAEGKDVYRCFVLPTNLTENRDVVGVEIRAGNKSVVHHVLVYVDDKGRARARDAADPGPGYTSFSGPGFNPTGEMGGWAPGNIPRFLPEGIGRPLPKGADIILQVHYHANGKPEEDRTSIGLHFAKKPVARHLRVFPVLGRNLRIPPGESNFRVTGGIPVPFDARAIAVTPHMHLLGRTMKLTATLPDGTTKPLVFVDDWDFKWQDTYFYKEPIRLPKGSRIELEATYDNSDKNPRNPNNPPKLVTWGEETTDEMAIGFINYIVEDEKDPRAQAMDAASRRDRRAGR